MAEKDGKARISERNTDRSSPRRDVARRADTQLVVGRLKDHGAARYQFRPDQDESYYVKMLTDRGERILWGKDLKRAIESSTTQPKIGELIGAQRIAREAVTITERKRDSAGQVTSQSEHHAHRTRWRVEKVKFFADRAKLARQVRDAHADAREAVRAHPELKSTFLTVRAAEEFADRRIANPEDRARFLELVRAAMSGSIKKGEPLPPVRLKEAPRANQERKQGTSRDEPTR